VKDRMYDDDDDDNAAGTSRSLLLLLLFDNGRCSRSYRSIDDDDINRTLHTTSSY
jgi:hypothetical protein